MANFKPYETEKHTEKNVKVEFFKDEGKSIMLARLTGVLSEGSKAKPDCSYIKQELAINLLAMRPSSLLLDMSLLQYSFGNSFIDALSPLFELQIFEDKYDIAFLLSDLNKYGLSSLWNFDINQPPVNIFFRYEDAVKYAEAKYDFL
ncbi:hypothetical protein ESA94_03100 [Lacibacter luteus]|uniref:STAS/SEC14 domain-containing protein n=1 Tax=Lacibacter luteus TaxID=2508719 RepID=A0A4Q1CLV8_9BACT|nr:hypothetical protein [Lacibacter luteus]RXK62018.1 hypothetical protein ESA94_03100 [Lacibacter luteus]